MGGSSHHWAYDLLKTIASKESCSQEDLDELKETFAAEIGSVRKASRISSVHELIDLLERHDELSESNIEPLREMANQYGSIAMQQAVNAYQAPKETTFAEPVNEYQEERLAEEMKQKLNLSPMNTLPQPTDRPFSGFNSLSVAPSMTMPSMQPQQPAAVAQTPFLTEQKRAAIYKRMSTKLGTDWRSFGRELAISEGDMDEVELQFPRDIKSRVYRLLQIFEEDECQDPKKIFVNICRALDGCRRKDIRREIEEIVSI